MTQSATALTPETTSPTHVAVGPGWLRTRLGTVLASHAAVDFYAQMFPPLLAVLETRCHLTEAQAATVLGIGPLASGVSQPLAAWLSDRLDSRFFGPAGLAVGAVCLCLIGLADSFATLMLLYTVGIIGTGVYHPIGASSIGQLGNQMIGRHGSRRSLTLSLFFVAGMVGGIAGATFVPMLTAQENGFRWLYFIMVPGLAIALALNRGIRRVPHRHEGHNDVRLEPAESQRRWRDFALLYVSAAMRFTVNIALFYLVFRWAQSLMASEHPQWAQSQINEAASQINGKINGALLTGMLIGGLAAGWLIQPGREKWPLVLVPWLGVPAIAAFPLAGVWSGWMLAVLAGIGYAAMVPVTMSVAQRLLPHRTSLASGLVLGGAWAVAVLGPHGAQFCLGQLGLSLQTTFLLASGLLGVAGIVCLFVSAGMLQSTLDAAPPAGSRAQ